MFSIALLTIAAAIAFISWQRGEIRGFNSEVQAGKWRVDGFKSPLHYIQNRLSCRNMRRQPVVDKAPTKEQRQVQSMELAYELGKLGVGE